MDVPTPHPITEPLIMLCEGKSDNEFFMRLLRQYSLPQFSFPFPPQPDDESPAGPALHSRDGFVNMLGRLNDYFDLVPDLKTKTKGVLIALDAADDPVDSFRHARKQIRSAGKFGLPDAAGHIATSADRPPIAILVVPPSGKGGLETLCVEAIQATYPDHANCMDQFFSCCPTNYVLDWNAESYEKAKLRVMIAATYRPDPSRSTTMVFSKRGNQPAAIDVGNPIFKPLSDLIGSFCKGVGQ
jgi:hypothetical protein